MLHGSTAWIVSPPGSSPVCSMFQPRESWARFVAESSWAAIIGLSGAVRHFWKSGPQYGLFLGDRGSGYLRDELWRPELFPAKPDFQGAPGWQTGVSRFQQKTLSSKPREL